MSDCWDVLSDTLCFTALPWVEVVREAVRLPTGRVIEDYYRVGLPEFAVIVAWTREGQLVMVRGYKHGTRSITLSAPAGLVEQGESPRAAAERELREETGFESSDWKRLGSFVVDGNHQCGTAHVYVARSAEQTAPPQNPDDTEQLVVELLTPSQFLTAALSGEVGLLNAVGAVALAMIASVE